MTHRINALLTRALVAVGLLDAAIAVYWLVAWRRQRTDARQAWKTVLEDGFITPDDLRDGV